jgi:hypothetical protein
MAMARFIAPWFKISVNFCSKLLIFLTSDFLPLPFGHNAAPPPWIEITGVVY